MALPPPLTRDLVRELFEEQCRQRWQVELRAATLEEVERIPTPAFGKTFGDDVSKLKAAIFHYGATLDRGQGFNPTTGEQYKDRMDRAVAAVEALCEKGGAPDVTGERLKGRWELVFSSVPHGIFRSSPFFEAIYDSYETVHESNCRGASTAES